MAYTGTLTTEAEIAIYVGENVDATGDTEANRNLLVSEAEGTVAGFARYDWVTNYADVSFAGREILGEYCARLVAIALISYNMAGYTSRIEAEDMLNVCLFRMRLLEKIISDQKWVTWVTT